MNPLPSSFHDQDIGASARKHITLQLQLYEHEYESEHLDVMPGYQPRSYVLFYVQSTDTNPTSEVTFVLSQA